ncbi:MAG: LptA/OstA family protein, partial [Pseudomonadota bacterium]
MSISPGMPTRVAIAVMSVCVIVAVSMPATAQQEGPFGGFQHDSSEPIEITSDALEVQQQNNVAIFTGDVIAGQGT